MHGGDRSSSSSGSGSGSSSSSCSSSQRRPRRNSIAVTPATSNGHAPVRKHRRRRNSAAAQNRAARAAANAIIEFEALAGGAGSPCNRPTLPPMSPPPLKAPQHRQKEEEGPLLAASVPGLKGLLQTARTPSGRPKARSVKWGSDEVFLITPTKEREKAFNLANRLAVGAGLKQRNSALRAALRPVQQHGAMLEAVGRATL